MPKSLLKSSLKSKDFTGLSVTIFFKTEMSFKEIFDTRSSSEISKLFDILEILDSL